MKISFDEGLDQTARLSRVAVRAAKFKTQFDLVIKNLVEGKPDTTAHYDLSGSFENLAAAVRDFENGDGALKDAAYRRHMSEIAQRRHRR